MSKELVSERESLLAQLNAQVRSIRDEFTVCTQTQPPKIPLGKNETIVTGAVQWAHQLKSRTQEILSTAEDVLADLPGMEAFVPEALEVLDELNGFSSLTFDLWKNDATAALEDSDPESGLMLETTGRLMDFDHRDGKLLVHYSDRHVSLRREVRHLSALGFVIPAAIKKAAVTAQKFHRYETNRVIHFFSLR